MHVGHAFPKLVIATLLMGVVMCTGCQKTEIFPVSGKLMIDGKPAGRANLVFHAVDPQIIARPVAFTDPDGSFRLMTHVADDGAAPGDYVVTVFWRDESIPFDECAGTDLVKHDRLKGLYFDSRRSPLRATVSPGNNEFTIEAKGPAEQEAVVEASESNALRQIE